MIHLPWNCLESITSTSEIGAVGDVVQNIGILVQHWVDEADSSLAGVGALLVDLCIMGQKNCSLQTSKVFKSALTRAMTEANTGADRLVPKKWYCSPLV